LDDFSASEDSTCFAVPISNQFSTLDVEEVPQDTHHPETPDPIDAIPPQQLQRSIRRKKKTELLQLLNRLFALRCVRESWI